jgi:hypothetical protein
VAKETVRAASRDGEKAVWRLPAAEKAVRAGAGVTKARLSASAAVETEDARRLRPRIDLRNAAPSS